MAKNNNPPKKPKGTKKPPGGGKSSNIRPYFTTSKGRKVWAKDYGYEGWPIGGRS